jgi:hypothetical protein
MIRRCLSKGGRIISYRLLYENKAYTIELRLGGIGKLDFVDAAASLRSMYTRLFVLKRFITASAYNIMRF